MSRPALCSSGWLLLLLLLSCCCVDLPLWLLWLLLLLSRPALGAAALVGCSVWLPKLLCLAAALSSSAPYSLLLPRLSQYS